MKERPILFSAPMVRAILSGQKTQTRRVVKDRHIDAAPPACFFQWLRDNCPYGQPGDRLWVRETWQGPLLESDEQIDEFRQSPDTYKKPGFCAYRATDTLDAIDQDGKELGWRPSIHMPRWASRILLEVTGVSVERLQDISEEDAAAEGISDGGCLNCGEPEPCGCADPKPDARDAFARLWHSINGEESWHANPWVWVVEFKRVEGGAA